MTTGINGIGGSDGIAPGSAWLFAGVSGATLTPVEVGRLAALDPSRGGVLAFAPSYQPGSGALAHAPTTSAGMPPVDPAPRPGIGLGVLGRAAGFIGMLLTPTNSGGSVTEIVGQPATRR